MRPETTEALVFMAIGGGTVGGLVVGAQWLADRRRRAVNERHARRVAEARAAAREPDVSSVRVLRTPPGKGAA